MIDYAEQKHRAEAKRDYLQGLVRQFTKELAEAEESVKIWSKPKDNRMTDEEFAQVGKRRK